MLQGAGATLVLSQPCDCLVLVQLEVEATGAQVFDLSEGWKVWLSKGCFCNIEDAFRGQVVNWHLCGQVNVRVVFQGVFVPNTLISEKATGLAFCPPAVAKSIRELHLNNTLPGLVGQGSLAESEISFWKYSCIFLHLLQGIL